MSENNAILKIGEEELSIPIITGSENEHALDISKLRGSTGYVTLDVGFKNTGSTKSAITYLDGEQGILRHRGYSIEDLASKASYLEVTYLLINGKLPNQAELDTFDHDIRMHTLVNTDMENIFHSFPTGSHPMGQLMCLVSSLSAFYPGSLNTHPTPERQLKTITRLLAKMPTICAMIYKKKWGHPLVYPNNSLDYVSNFLNMTFGQVTMNYETDPVVADAMNKLLILHADHEQNCSASTVRLVGSSHANLYSSIAAGIAALWGPLHGGANQQVIEMLEKIKADGGNVQKFIDKAKDKNDTFRLMGFGHRVYKNFDPRARIIKKSCDEVLAKLGIHDPILDIAKELEEAALNDPYFAERKLYPNVDFYSGIIYKALDIPNEMFTVMFALGRLPGWVAHWREMRLRKEPIGRPRQVYIGENLRTFTDIKSR